MIQVLHLDTLSEAFELRVSKKYTMQRIMVDEHHVVAMSLRRNKQDWFMTIFDLATCSANGGDNRAARDDKTARKFFLPERHIRLSDVKTVYLYSVFLLDGWLVVPGEDENKIFWFDKNGKRSETSTELDTKIWKEMYSFDSSLLFAQHDGKLLLKR